MAEITDGQFRIQLFAPGEIVGAFQSLDAAQAGTVEAAYSPSFFFVGKDPTFAIGSALPFGLNVRQHNAWVHEAGGLELLNAFYDTYNVHHIPFGHTCAQMAGWYRKEITQPEDFQGLRIRISGIAGQVLQRLGAVPQQTAVSDIYPSLERGTIDAAELSGPMDDEAAGLAKVAPYYYYPGWQEPTAATGLFINRQAWESLPKTYQAALQAAAAEGERRMIAGYDVGNAAALERVVAAGAQFKAFPSPVLKALFEASENLMAEIAASNENFGRIYGPWREYRTSIARWFSIAETPTDLTTQSFLRQK
ncbi:MAG: TRAP transporter substrate-binding protein DctP [Rhizobiaceae bacterium]|nr:TRAP transporter substrate-binding protein DctP [Rhizobiaceae bacterium]